MPFGICPGAQLAGTHEKNGVKVPGSGTQCVCIGVGEDCSKVDGTVGKAAVSVDNGTAIAIGNCCGMDDATCADVDASTWCNLQNFRRHAFCDGITLILLIILESSSALSRPEDAAICASILSLARPARSIFEPHSMQEWRPRHMEGILTPTRCAQHARNAVCSAASKAEVSPRRLFDVGCEVLPERRATRRGRRALSRM